MKFLLEISHFGFMQIIVFGCLLTGGYYYFYFNNGKELRQSILNTETATQLLAANIKKKEAELNSLIMFKNEILLKEKLVMNFLNYVPNELSFIDVFSLLNKAAKISGVNIEDKKDQPVVKKDSYEILKIKLKISGAFPQIVLFFSHLTDQKRVLIVNRVSMNIRSGDKKSILADLDIFAFRYNNDQKQEEKVGG